MLPARKLVNSRFLRKNSNKGEGRKSKEMREKPRQSLTQPGARRLLHGHKTDRVPVAKSIRS